MPKHKRNDAAPEVQIRELHHELADLRHQLKTVNHTLLERNLQIADLERQIKIANLPPVDTEHHVQELQAEIRRLNSLINRRNSKRELAYDVVSVPESNNTVPESIDSVQTPVATVPEKPQRLPTAGEMSMCIQCRGVRRATPCRHCGKYACAQCLTFHESNCPQRKSQFAQ